MRGMKKKLLFVIMLIPLFMTGCSVSTNESEEAINVIAPLELTAQEQEVLSYFFLDTQSYCLCKYYPPEGTDSVEFTRSSYVDGHLVSEEKILEMEQEDAPYGVISVYEAGNDMYTIVCNMGAATNMYQGQQFYVPEEEVLAVRYSVVKEEKIVLNQPYRLFASVVGDGVDTEKLDDKTISMAKAVDIISVTFASKAA